MKYTRKDPSVCIVNNKYLYVFMGYCDEIGGVICNYEKLDILKNGKFFLLTIFIF